MYPLLPLQVASIREDNPECRACSVAGQDTIIYCTSGYNGLIHLTKKQDVLVIHGPAVAIKLLYFDIEVVVKVKGYSEVFIPTFTLTCLFKLIIFIID